LLLKHFLALEVFLLDRFLQSFSCSFIHSGIIQIDGGLFITTCANWSAPAHRSVRVEETWSGPMHRELDALRVDGVGDTYIVAVAIICSTLSALVATLLPQLSPDFKFSCEVILVLF